MPASVNCSLCEWRGTSFRLRWPAACNMRALICGPPLLVVLGHEGCGAIQAALETKDKGVRQHSRIQLLVDGIMPNLAGLDPQLPPAARLAQAVESNVRCTVRTILESPEGRA